MAILNRELIQYLVVHASATSPNMNIGAKEINDMHLAKGWSEIGYHFVIRRDKGPLGGCIEYGRSLNLIGAHVKGYNSVSIGVCMVGGVDKYNKPENNFTDRQFEMLKKTFDFLSALHPKAKICGHNSFPGVRKSCPCFRVEDWWLKNKDITMPIVEPKPILANTFEW